jgi:hypothetical protein
MRTGAADPLWLLGDHLGSTSVAANYDGSLYTRQGCKAWGEQRYSTGVSPLPTTPYKLKPEPRCGVWGVRRVAVRIPPY